MIIGSPHLPWVFHVLTPKAVDGGDFRVVTRQPLVGRPWLAFTLETSRWSCHFSDWILEEHKYLEVPLTTNLRCVLLLLYSLVPP